MGRVQTNKCIHSIYAMSDGGSAMENSKTGMADGDYAGWEGQVCNCNGLVSDSLNEKVTI